MKFKLSDIAVLTIALFFLGLFELFPRPGWVDPGIYTGYVINPDIYKYYTLEAHSYQGSRLGYILPLQFFSHFLGEVYGRGIYALVLYFAYLTSLTMLIQFFIKRDLERQLLSILFIFNPVFISSIFYGGADGPAAVQLLVAISLVVYAARAISSFERSLISFFAGFFLLFSISAHIFIIVPALLIVPILLHLLKAVRLGMFMIFGGAVAISICAFFGFKLGLNKFYFFYSLPWARGALSGSGLLFVQPLTYWFKNAIFWLPVIVSIALFFLINRNPAFWVFKQPILSMASLINLSGPLIIFVCYDVFIGGSLLSTPAYFNIVFPSFVIGTILMVSLRTKTESSNGNESLDLSKIDKTSNALIPLVCLSIILTFSGEHVRSVFSFNSVKSHELYRSQVSFMNRIKLSDLNFRKLQFVFTAVSSDREFDVRVYKDFYRGVPRFFDYIDSLTALFLWDRSIALRLDPNTNHSVVSFKTSDGAAFVFLGRSKAEVQRLVASLSSFPLGYAAGAYQCYYDINYPWCYIVFENGKNPV